MTKTFTKLAWLIGVLLYLFEFFRDAQAHRWGWVVFWAFMVCVCAEASSKLRWKNFSITSMIDGKVVHVEWYWTKRGGLKKFNKDRDEILQAYQDAGLPVYDHTTEKK